MAADRKRFVRVSSFGFHLLMTDLDEHFPAKEARNEKGYKHPLGLYLTLFSVYLFIFINNGLIEFKIFITPAS